ncbi:uncharacterized protein LOC113225719 [Hyposmocoma kahamanoa]|uniref:uncharacterized protein LOC113225719 n=1 Tax=Hyposmocoma kahamanoa TaxID=1477025 RepID=UPI000E6DA34E|nr:uncharacterized protein LOC113225719 [Hyposmocoma kahamanoa]
MDLNDQLLTKTQNPKPAVLEGKPKSAPQTNTNTQRPTVSGRPKGKPQGQPSTDAGASTTPAVVAQTPGSAAPAQNPSNAARKNKKARRRERERRTSHNPLPKEGEARPPVGGASGPGTASARSNGSVAHPTGRAPPPSNSKPGESRQRSSTIAKRARLDETISPRGEHKRQKVERPAQQRTYAEATRPELMAVITSAKTGYIRSPDADMVQVALCQRLTQGAEECSEEDVGPQFRGKPVYSDGSLKLWCQDTATFQWLEDAISTIRLPSGEPLSLKNGVEAPRRVVCGLLIPGHWEDARRIGRILKWQNPWAEAHRWVVHRLQQHSGNSFVVVSLPEELVPAVLGHGRRLTFQLGTVYLRFRSKRGLYTDVPPEKTGTTTTRMDVSPEPSTSSNIPGEGEGPSSTPVSADAAVKPVATSSDDECVLGMGDIRLSEDVDEELLSSDGGFPLAQ